MTRTSDTRITGYEPLLSPAALLDQLPLDDEASATVEQSRAEVRAVLDGSDDRLLVIAGPCSGTTRRPRSTTPGGSSKRPRAQPTC
jgi:3-deoxy-D-arabino-heptulosonate 7-phosphate (DAHP) synthase